MLMQPIMIYRVALRSLTILAVALLAMAFSGKAIGEEPKHAGQGDLDKATQLKLSAQTSADLEKVIRLCESAQKKGLDKDSVSFARNMILSSLVQRGVAVATSLLNAPITKADWPKIRPQRDNALADLEKAVKLDPDQADAWFFIARLNLSLPEGNPKLAAKALEQAAKAAGEDRPLLAKILGLQADITKDPQKKQVVLDHAIKLAPQDAGPLFARALLLADQGKLKDSLTDLDKVVQLEPRSPVVLQAMALVLMRLKKYDEALLALDKIHDLDPNAIFPYIQQARIHVLQTNLQAALHDLDEAVKLDATNVEVLLLRAEIQHELKQIAPALADIESVLALHPGNPMAIRLRAAFLAADGKIDQAIQQMEALRTLEGKDPATLSTLAMLYAIGKHSQSAIDAFTAVLAVDPKNASALRNRGDLYLGMGKHEEAIADFNRAFALDPQDPGLLNNLAWVLATSTIDKLRDGKRALELATKACKLTDYKKDYILSTLAAAYAETGDMKKAVEYSEKSIAISTDEHRAALEKELQSYHDGKPWRELIAEDETPKTKPAVAKNNDAKQQDAKPESAESPAKPQSTPHKHRKAEKSSADL